MTAQAKTQAKTFSIIHDAPRDQSAGRQDLRKPICATQHIERTNDDEGQREQRRAWLTILKGKIMKKLLSIGEVANQLSVSRSTVYRLVDAGKLKRFYVLSSPRISESEVERFMGCGK